MDVRGRIQTIRPKNKSIILELGSIYITQELEHEQ